MYKNLLVLLFTITTLSCLAQGNKRMEIETFDIWNTITKPQISNDGNWVVYTVGNEAGDPTLHIYNHKTGSTVKFHRGKDAQISDNSQWLAFKLTTAVDTIRAMKKKKVKKDDLPKDSLVIYHLEKRTVRTIADVKSFKMPKEWNDWVVYHKELVPIEDKKEVATDSTAIKKSKPKKPKKEDGTLLVYHDLRDAETYSFPGVLDYQIAMKNPTSIFSNSGKYDGYQAGVYAFDFKSKTAKPLFRQKGKYKKLAIDEAGQQAAFLADLDTTKNKVRPLGLYYWKNSKDTARLVEFTMPKSDSEQLNISANYRPRFSGDGQTLYYGLAPFPFLQDTNLLKEDIVNVEVWHYQDQRLHTQQNVQLKDDKKQTYLKAWNPKTQKSHMLTSVETPDFEFNHKRNGEYMLAIDDQSMRMSSTWDGFPFPKNVYLVNQKTGQRKEIGNSLRANPGMSVGGKYAYWFNVVDTAWFAYPVEGKGLIKLTHNKTVPFYDELNDRPMLPNSYGAMGWAKNDEYLYIYDRYDIWQVDPNNPNNKKNLTNGRDQKITYRYVRLDRENPAIDPKSDWVLHYFDHKDKSSGYVRLNSKSAQLTPLIGGDYRYSRRIRKAKNANQLIFTKENFQDFPNLEITNLDFKNPKKISDANPRQKEYAMGTIELVKWIDLNGNELEGLLVKPPNFDPNKKYPMMVNFYERSSQNLHRHHTPHLHRSSINYSFYANRGYLIFNPDVPYRVGYPGESAYNSVMSGVTAMIEKGFVDRERIGVQGHSWGGYQVAYLTTKTNLFRCAESGAPVVNMFSAYGGIRWGSGLSRMFQYENTQSRIGGTIWEYPLRYLENSPIFFLDKVETPLLILHNDKDGAVPWYQGIEYFVGLRRLGKPAWMLNYNDEPHWPVKRPNRVDFQKRMAQFFDYYLQDAPMPEWMKRGVPAMEKGIRQGY